MLVQNSSFPLIHNRAITFSPSGGGDQHLFLTTTPSTTPIIDFLLDYHAWLHGPQLHAVISSQLEPSSGLRMIFFTQRTQTLAALVAALGCDPEAPGGEWQVEFRLLNGGGACVRQSSGGGGWDLWWKPEGVGEYVCVRSSRGGKSLILRGIEALECVDVVLAKSPPI
jgi:hypothetical protein